MTKQPIDDERRQAAERRAKAMTPAELIAWAHEEAAYWRHAGQIGADPRYLGAAARLDALADALATARHRILLLESACAQLRYGNLQN